MSEHATIPKHDDEPTASASYRDLREVVKEGRQKRDAGRAQLYALEIPTSVIVGCILGQLADTHLGVAPWGFPIGLLAGLGAAVRAIVRLIAWQKANDPDDDAGPPPVAGAGDGA
ncbi:MAG: AtpZ/AtpI family protein [Deltaproteobacteria bacterium]|nr:AtpZ/AtpI family protein [Deltaproteobacteria bacterium]